MQMIIEENDFPIHNNNNNNNHNINDDAVDENKKKQENESSSSSSSSLNTPLFTTSQITKRISIPMSQTSSLVSIERILNDHIHRFFEGRCISEGFVQPQSSKILRTSCGLFRGSDVIYSIVFQCNICIPFDGMQIECSVRDITKAGVRGAAKHEIMSPFVVFVPRDPNIVNPMLNKMKMDDTFVASVIGFRYEINDKFISIIANIVDVDIII